MNNIATRSRKLAARLQRLSELRCPIHGIFMPQINVELKLMPCGHHENGRSIVQCPRRDCGIKIYATSDGWELFPEFYHILTI